MSSEANLFMYLLYMTPFLSKKTCFSTLKKNQIFH